MNFENLIKDDPVGMFVSVSIFAVFAIVLLIFKNKGLSGSIQGLIIESQNARASLDQELDQLREEIQRKAVEFAETSTRLASSEDTLARARSEISKLTQEREDLFQRLSDAEKNNAVVRTELQENRQAHDERMKEWDTVKKQAIEAANAATLESATKLSSKLLEDHQRQNEVAKKETEERVKQTTEQLVNQITEVGKTIHALNSDVETNRGTMETVMRALSSPGGAGQFSEIGLENTLTSFGLVKGRDFVTQQQVEGKRLRPDAMVFLPGNTVLVIDSKASKFLLDLAEAENEQAETDAYASLARTMNTHLKQLSDKNYKAEVISGYQSSGRKDTAPRVVSVMYVPNEGAIEKVSIADPQFLQKAAKLQITIAGPAALACLIGFARVQLDVERQSENQEKIVEGAQKIVESIGVIVDETVAVGKGLKSATQHYNKMTGSINSRLLPRIRQMVSFGIQSNRHKQVPDAIPTYSFTEHERGDLIEGDAEEIDEASLLNDRTDEN